METVSVSIEACLLQLTIPTSQTQEHCLSVGSERSHVRKAVRCGSAGHVMSISIATSRLHTGLRGACARRTPTVCPLFCMPDSVADPKVDPPIKRFAERHKYFHIDSIAVRDVGYVPPSPGRGTRNGGSKPISRQDNFQSLTSKFVTCATPVRWSQCQSTSSKRARSPEHRRTGEDSRDYPSKRARDSDGWVDGGGGGRYKSPMWERDRERSAWTFKDERKEEKSTPLPSALNWFMGTLPAPNAFNGVYSCPAS